MVTKKQRLVEFLTGLELVIKKQRLVEFLTGLVLVIINAGVFSLLNIAVVSMDLGETQEFFWVIVNTVAMIVSWYWLLFRITPKVVNRIVRFCESRR